MKRKDFPSTPICGENYVVKRSLLERWVAKNAQKVNGVNSELIPDWFDLGNSGKEKS